MSALHHQRGIDGDLANLVSCPVAKPRQGQLRHLRRQIIAKRMDQRRNRRLGSTGIAVPRLDHRAETEVMKPAGVDTFGTDLCGDALAKPGSKRRT